MSVEFGDLPEKTNGPTVARRTEMFAVANELRAHPGCWARIESDLPASKAATTAANWRRGYLAFQPIGAYEFAARMSADTPGRSDVWARYVGELA